MELEAKLLMAEMIARRELGYFVSTTSALVMLKVWLKTFATSAHDFPAEELVWVFMCDHCMSCAEPSATAACWAAAEVDTILL